MTTSPPTDADLVLTMRLDFAGGSGGPALGDFCSLMASLAGLVAITEPRNRGYLLGPSPVNSWTALRFDLPHQPVLHRVRAESPIEIELVLPAAIAAMPLLATFIYAAKRVFAIDLEFRGHREWMRVNYLEAKVRAQELERRVTAAEVGASDLGDPDVVLSSGEVHELITASKQLSDAREPWQATSAAIVEFGDLAAPPGGPEPPRAEA